MGQEQSVQDKQDGSVSKTCPDMKMRGVYVLNAMYGDLKADKMVDCTMEMQEYLKGDHCIKSYDGRCLLLSFPYNKKKHELLKIPDPSKGHQKSLKLVYGLDGAQHTATLGEYEAWTVKSLFIPDSKLLADCSISSYFDDSELILLYEDFRVECWPDSVLKRDQFIKLLPIFNNDAILNSFFNLMDKNGDGGIDFSEYARALSIMSRGSSDDKIQLTFELLDLDRNGSLELKEVLLILNEVSKRMVSLGFDEDSFGVVSESVTELFEKRQDKLNQSVLSVPLSSFRMYGIGQITDLFVTPFSSVSEANNNTSPDTKSKEEKHSHHHSKKDDKHRAAKEDRGEDVDSGDSGNEGEEDDGKQDEDFLAASGIKEKKIVLMSSITLYDFKIRAQNDPNIGDAFGMFDYFQKIVIDPVEQRLNKDRESNYAGWLTKDKGDSLYNKTLSVVSGTDKRYFMIRDGFMAYYKSDKPADLQKPIRVISLDSAKIMLGLTDSCYLSTPSFIRNLYAPSNRTEIKRFVNLIRKNTGRTYENRSFAPIRWGINARWFINGNQYFEALLKILARARKAIYITDWYFSPGLHLCRKGAPNELNKSNRLDNVLLQRAEAGVKIYILIWNASAKVFHLESPYVTTYMNKLHSNIIAMRHPNWTPIVWSHHQKTVVVDEEIAFLGGIDLCYSRYDDSRYLVVDNDESTFPGRDYSNLNIIGEENGNPLQAVIDREKLPRMPWHDIHMQIDGAAARDVGINFVQRWNHAMYQSAGVQFNNHATYILPITEENLVPNISRPKSQTATALRKKLELSRQGPTHLVENEKDLGYAGCQVQIVRSAALWSAGIEKPERSIYRAYLKVIHSAEHYIYIENQYFISSIARIRPKNKIAKALWTRLRKAIIQKQQFKVIVVIPVYPAGDLALPATRYIIKYVYKTINRQKNSILEKLHEEFPEVDLNEYIHFCALRNWGTLKSGAVVTEQVYVHAKMLLADDRIAIIGSANINDRSMRGTRDSEIAAVLEQDPSQMVDSVMAGKPYKVSPYVYDLRIRLWRDYLGLGEEEEKNENVEALRDAVSDECYKRLWLNTAQENTSAYLSLFTDLPDKFKTFGEMMEWKKKIMEAQQMDSSETTRKWFKNMEDKLKEKVRGFLVFFPLSFLEKEQTELSPGLVTKEYLLPRYVFL
eukprot:TRINITY_DN6502_c0_g1_i1.p1 TRINITY_DN6502_c0_g1~~TRINITY_DN6502_c0_g1_i1.p1  ORF type:complete len:1166 (-),score=298.89 TRINITY_DN6502_c0_g1_i1:43-3540(-)